MNVMIKKRQKENNCIMNIFPAVIQNQKSIETNEQLISQLSELYEKIDSSNPRAYHCTKKPHAVMLRKRFTVLYLEDLKFLIKRCAWGITNIYSHYTFEQARFKRNFALMNQKKTKC